jgi:hypothetical protein
MLSQLTELAAQEKPATTAVHAGPDVGERGHWAEMHRGAGLFEGVCGGAWGAIDMRLEPIPVEGLQQIAQALGRASELRAMVDVKNSNGPADHLPCRTVAARPASLAWHVPRLGIATIAGR